MGWEEVIKDNYAVAILEATVRSLSSFILFRSNACCLQSSRFEQLWCSGSRCCKKGGNVHQSKPTQYMTGGDTHRTAELRTTMWALANDAQRCRVALSVGADLRLAALLGSHGEVS